MPTRAWAAILLVLGACRSVPPPQTAPSLRPAVSAVLAPKVSAYQVRLDKARLAHSEILKAAGAAFVAGKLGDEQVGRVRAAARQTDLEINIATSLLGLFASEAATAERVDRAFRELDVSLRALTNLWSRYGGKAP